MSLGSGEWAACNECKVARELDNVLECENTLQRARPREGSRRARRRILWQSSCAKRRIWPECTARGARRPLGQSRGHPAHGRLAPLPRCLARDFAGYA